jgi:gliding motility-associated lipoprotein GldH
MPEYDDSAATYDITLAVRYDNSYRYRNLTMAVDVITADSAVNRRTVDMALADEYGNWTGGGFGTLYQSTVPVVEAVTPDEARSIVVWQSMGECDTLRGLVNLGIITTPATKK